ncbi:MAG: carboxypeptidase regulatory-like domain-containing protein [Phaeodactylibacter sp.]|nr:carboxypeptidase regulatory-like domain-containing protein [Phaeodactylibacter sp.]
MKKGLRLLIAMTLVALGAALPPGLWAQDCISGLVYEDSNNSGAFDAGDQLLDGIEVELEYPDGTNSVITTNGVGFYEFCSLQPGNYKIFALYSTVNYFTSYGVTELVLIQGQSINNMDFPLTPLTFYGAVNGLAFFDFDGDGQKKRDEPSLPMASIRETFGPGTIDLLTNSNGAFNQNFLTPGLYTYEITSLPPGAVLISPASVALDIGSSTTADVLFRLDLQPDVGGIVDFACLDLDNNGTIDAADPGIANMLVTLMDLNGQVISTTTSDDNGLYSFLGLQPGDYMVEVNASSFQAPPTTPTVYQVAVSAGEIARVSPFYFGPADRIFECGMAVATCFSGYDPGTQTIVDNFVFGVFDTRNPPTLDGATWSVSTVPAIKPASWKSGNIGQVFGIATDMSNNIYLTASSSYNFYDPVKANSIGFGGSGAVYKIDNSLAPAVFTTLPNGGNTGLGNICFDKTNDQFFVSNFEDGKIYRISNSGAVLSSYDPYFNEPPATGMDDGTNGFVPVGQRVWAVGIYDNQLYFSRWTHNFGNSSPSTPQQIWVVPLTSGGEFSGSLNGNSDYTGAEVKIIDVISYGSGKWSAPVSDLAFSEDGTLLIAERGMSNVSSVSAHRSRIIKYPSVAGNYSSANYQLIYIGNYDSFDNSNSAGGVAINPGGYDPTTGEFSGCDSLILGTGDALRWGITKNCSGTGNGVAYGFAIMPFEGNSNSIGNGLPLPPVNCSSRYVHLGASKSDLGEIETFACPTCLQVTADCSQFNLSVAANPQDSLTTDSCCYTLDYLNGGTQNVYGIQFEALDGVEFNPNYTLAAGFQVGSFSSSLLEVIPTLAWPNPPAPMPAQVNGLISNLCLENVLAFPQYILVNYLDFQNGEFQVFCTDTLILRCPVQETCLYIVSDSLICDSLGYKYTATVKNPPGADFPVGYIKLNIEPDIPGLTVLGGEGIILTDTLQQGDTTTLMWTLVTSDDLYGDSLCFILSAHDGVEERLCCAEIDTCIAFPACDPCKYVDVTIKPLVDDQVGECCYELFVTDTFTYDPALIQSIQANILNAGVYFSGVDALPAQLDGWNVSPPLPTLTNTLLWTHGSGITPNGVSYNLFDFCIQGTTSTDSVYIAINWLDADSMVVCTDTLAVFCPDCLNVVNDSLTCITNADGTQDYAYTFQVVNYSPFDVNTIGIVEIPSNNTLITPDVISIPTIPAYPPGGTSVPITILIDGSAGPIDSFCFDIVLRQVIIDSIDIVCCYATHCINLPECDSLPPFLCPDPNLISQVPCAQVWDPVCGCDDMTYSNTCFATNAGVTLWTPGLCDSMLTPDPRVILTGSLDPSGGVLLEWMLDDNPDSYAFFVLIGRWPGESEFKDFAIVPVNPGQQSYNFLHVNSMPGLNDYQVIAVNNQGQPVYSNKEQVLMMNEAQRRALVYTYPVPATHTIYVTSNWQGEAVVELIGADGRTLLQREENFEGLPVPVNVSGLGSGVYLVRLRFNDGQVGQQRMVKME